MWGLGGCVRDLQVVGTWLYVTGPTEGRKTGAGRPFQAATPATRDRPLFTSCRPVSIRLGPDIPCVQTANELPHLNAAEGQHVGSNESNINKGAPALVAQWTKALEQDEHLIQEHALFDYVRGHSSLPLEGSCPPKSA